MLVNEETDIVDKYLLPEGVCGSTDTIAFSGQTTHSNNGNVQEVLFRSFRTFYRMTRLICLGLIRVSAFLDAPDRWGILHARNHPMPDSARHQFAPSVGFNVGKGTDEAL